ncbi:Uncharacterized conserved protein, DUF849 family [Limimonas halophila]|uniref:Uncharacterized conserved protein, DUF849 family n=1 Tax=Limimonas halophila TaxID=1082479 RepID=A0A1G7LXB3_9PROT|nr:3-keto-5-aminohexanoate cleavage protein [Limimonas halophila]SDF54142.1 Uncharacterized conserved protein, DUF849 family [Limimonas halophila]
MTWPPLLLAAAPNGARRTPADHPALPVTPDAIAETAAACRDAGAAMLHLHVRDREGRHTLDPAAYREAIAAVRARVGDDLVIQITTESAGRFRPVEQIAAVRAVRPEAVSVAWRELAPDARHERAAIAFLRWCRARGIRVQIILYTPDEVARWRAVETRFPGIAGLPRLYVLGSYAGAQADPADLFPFRQADAGSGAPWMVCAFGARETACAAVAMALGGDVRVGFENNLTLPDGARAPDNAALVAAAARAATAIGRTPAPVADLAARL